MRVPIYEARYDRVENDPWEYLNDPPEWLTKLPWHNFKSITLNGDDGYPVLTYRRRKVTEDEAYDMEEAHMNYIESGNYQ